ncbi:metallophosphoesterase [bacterium]|nr:metallophosphoesterase [candidate division CSSED10-310 bacterium]
MSERTTSFIIFFSIVILVYGSTCSYVFIRGWRLLPKGSILRTVYLWLFPLLALSFFIGRILRAYLPCTYCDVFIWIGAVWLGLYFYVFLFALVLDLAGLGGRLLHITPAWAAGIGFKRAMGVAAVAAAGLLVVIGHIHSNRIQVTRLELIIPKQAGQLRQLDIAVASDIHLGTVIDAHRLDQFVTAINKLNPDLILLPGDIVDGDIEPVMEMDMGEPLTRLKSTYGVFGVTGNHEYIGGAEETVPYLERKGVVFLRDQVVKVADSFFLAGREDPSIKHFAGGARKPLADMLSGVEGDQPVLLMDHQPFKLEEAAAAGVDLQVSGHTHHGQLFPNNLITGAIYEKDWGYLKKGGTHYYVSCGAGTWGPPMKTVGKSEIVFIRLRFETAV